ncbi:hypothetical protein CCR75_000945 [Bremia lactucae]|uniref:Uncharacterized protein n=1 Tax=Bremia lactucae TaxID=4779 RepID=A0A976IEM0_BRELC|nr:hypothetical protein CCR75_000945 [Bremia lactucae]
MGKIHCSAIANQEFASLKKVLCQTADDAKQCIRLLKQHLLRVDSCHGKLFIHSATVFMRNDMRKAKDTSFELKRVANAISQISEPSDMEIEAARNGMEAIAKAMDVLHTTARNYDKVHNQSEVVQSTFKVRKRDREQDHLEMFVCDTNTLEALVKSIVRDNFNLSALSHQITITQKSLTSSPSFVERAKEAVDDVKEKLRERAASRA